MNALEKYINRELSWLEFNHRVLLEADCRSNPLLERLKFVAISASNLDEFFKVRVGSLKFLQEHGSADKTAICGRNATQQLTEIHNRTQVMFDFQYSVLNQIESELKGKGIHRDSFENLDTKQKEYLRERFQKEFFDVISPIAIDDDTGFPLMLGANLGILARIRNEPNKTLAAESANEENNEQEGSRYVVFPIGRGLERMITLPSSDDYRFIFLEDIICEFLDSYFPHQKIEEVCCFRILRNADFTVDDDLSDDLLSDMKQALQMRKTGNCVSLQIFESASEKMVRFLANRLDVSDREIYVANGPLDLTVMMKLSSIQGYTDLKDEKWPAVANPVFQSSNSVFEAISEKDRLLIHPYQSFDPVIQLLESAANDPDVIAIKQTLYRTSKNSRIVAALARAAESGKNVTAIVELKARFDEERNISWARRLELAGVDVIYGIKGLKTHAKIVVVVRREPDGIKRYVHIGTGNYNEATASLYGDVSLLTCDEQMGSDCIAFFNAVTGYSIPQTLQKIVAAPFDLKKTLITLIEAETQNAKQGMTAAVTAKLNSLSDKTIIDALYKASQNGVKIRLNIRGICCLRPNVEGLSENIVVTSIIDRYLEHARIFKFENGGEPKVFISSADWMDRNLDKRVELMTPVEDEECKNSLIKALSCYFQDDVKSHVLQNDGTYVRNESKDSETPFQSQAWLYGFAKSLTEQDERTQATVFIPQRGDLDSSRDRA